MKMFTVFVKGEDPQFFFCEDSKNYPDDYLEFVKNRKDDIIMECQDYISNNKNPKINW